MSQSEQSWEALMILAVYNESNLTLYLCGTIRIILRIYA